MDSNNTHLISFHGLFPDVIDYENMLNYMRYNMYSLDEVYCVAIQIDINGRKDIRMQLQDGLFLTYNECTKHIDKRNYKNAEPFPIYFNNKSLYVDILRMFLALENRLTIAQDISAISIPKAISYSLTSIKSIEDFNDYMKEELNLSISDLEDVLGSSQYELLVDYFTNKETK